MVMAEERLPLITFKEMVRKRIGWCREWVNLAQSFDLTLDFQNREESLNIMRAAIEKVGERERINWVTRAQNASFHTIYRSLDVPLGGAQYLKSPRKVRDISWIIKVRGELLYMNDELEGNARCRLCNEEGRESTYHYVGVCSVFVGERMEILGRPVLGLDEFLTLLKTNVSVIPAYCRLTWPRRRDLLEKVRDSSDEQTLSYAPTGQPIGTKGHKKGKGARLPAGVLPE